MYYLIIYCYSFHWLTLSIEYFNFFFNFTDLMYPKDTKIKSGAEFLLLKLYELIHVMEIIIIEFFLLK